MMPRDGSGNIADAGPPARRYATIAAFDAALKAKLTARATPQRSIQALRKYLAFDRVLARLTAVAPDAWLLKGGVALEYRLEHARTTTDIDISARIGLGKMIDILEAATAVELDDYFALRLGEYSRPVEGVETYRFRMTVLYENGRTFEELAIDIGFADAWLGEPQVLQGPPLLDFAVHAAVAQALRETFSARGTHDVPSTLPRPPVSWQAVYPHLAADLPIPQTSDEAHRFVADTLAPALKAASQ